MTTPRTPENTSDRAFVDIARSKSMSTKDILLKLAVAPLLSKGIDISESDPVVKGIAIFETHTAQSKTKLSNKRFDNSKSIEEVCDTIQANIEQLGRVKSTAALSSGFTQELAPLKSEITRIIADREKIFAQLEKLLAEKNTVIDNLADQLRSGAASKTTIVNRIKQLQTIQDDITTQTTKMLVNEKALRPKLDALEFKAVSAAKVVGVAVETAPRPSSEGLHK